MTELASFHAKHIQSTSQSDGYYVICIYIILLEMQSIIWWCNNITCYRITNKIFKLPPQVSFTEITKMLHTSNILISYRSIFKQLLGLINPTKSNNITVISVTLAMMKLKKLWNAVPFIY